MDDRLPGWKLAGLVVGWVLASVMIAFVTAIVVAEVARAVGISYPVALTISFVVVLAAVLAVPVVVRRRS